MVKVQNKFAGSAAEKAMLADASLDVAWPLIEYSTTMVRESGSAEERKTFDYIKQQLDTLGVPNHLYEPELFLSVPISARVEMDARSFSAKAQAFSANTPPRGISGEVFYVPAESEDEVATFTTDHDYAARKYDVRGKIVLTEGLANPECCWDYEDRGAIAQIYVNPGQRSHWGIATTVWGMPDLDSMNRVPNTPVLAINRPDGDVLVKLARAGRLNLTVHSLSNHGWKKVPLLVAEIKGTQEPQKFILAHGHLDSWGVGGGDNAVGNAACLELARVFWKNRANLRRSIRIAWWPGHSTGRYAGSTWYADTFALDLSDNCIAQVNIDSPGCRFADSYEHQCLMAETAQFAGDAIKEVTGLTASGGRPHRAGDYSFNNIGISSYFMLLSTISEKSQKEKGYYGVGGCGGNIEWHSEDDTIAIADKDNLLRDIKVYITTLGRTANADVFPFDFRAVAQDLAHTLDTYAKAAGSRFDFTPAQAEVERFGQAAEGLYALAARAVETGDGAACARCNEAIMRLARILIPINFGREGRFRHDPAAPIRELPDLAPARTLADLSPDSDLAHFTVAHLVRGQNRLVDALRQAEREVKLASS